jgi:hypothetical protein
MARRPDRLTKLGLATTIAALWLTVVPITGAVANEQISAARAAAIHQCNLLAARYPPVLHGQAWPTRMIGKVPPQVA